MKKETRSSYKRLGALTVDTTVFAPFTGVSLK